MERFLPHKFISELDFLPRKLSVLPLATDIRDRVRPLSTVGSVKSWHHGKYESRVHNTNINQDSVFCFKFCHNTKYDDVIGKLKLKRHFSFYNL